MIDLKYFLFRIKPVKASSRLWWSSRREIIRTILLKPASLCETLDWV